jgi:uncharacterized alkaline shock family protein YloU
VANASDPRQPAANGQADARQVARVARAAALTIYGVKNVVGVRWYQRLADRLGFGSRGVSVRSTPALEVALNLELAPGVPRESVLSNVADAVKYTVRRDIGRPIDALTLTVDGT